MDYTVKPKFIVPGWSGLLSPVFWLIQGELWPVQGWGSTPWETLCIRLCSKPASQAKFIIGLQHTVSSLCFGFFFQNQKLGCSEMKERLPMGASSSLSPSPYKLYFTFVFETQNQACWEMLTSSGRSNVKIKVFLVASTDCNRDHK